MAGMFYSLQEVAEKLGKTEEEVTKLVQDGRLREFRDGSNLLFKVDEVEALLSDTSIMASEESPTEAEPQEELEEIALAPETTEGPTEDTGLTDADTAIVDEGISVLGDTDSEYLLTDDALGETKTGAGSDEASLKEIEEDVNLDTFGSGSGLLDLSLQADDTSLGGILDEIYTPEGKEGKKGEPGSVEMAAEAEQMISEQDLAMPQPTLEAPAIARAYVEPAPDTLSNAFGIMLFLPLLAIVYAAIVVVTGFSLDMDGPYGIFMIWYIMIGVAVAAALVVGISFILAGGGTKTTKKPKAKKAKKPKAKKEKKPKKSKK